MRWARLAYDPWGKRRYADGSDDPTWSITSESNRGFTGHEQMDEVGLVNMNARLYDPEVGRFVSPDAYIQYAEDSQSYNRYAYARNNPLSITDPSGNFWFIAIAVAAFAISQLDFVQDLIQSSPILGALIQIAFAATGHWYYAALGAAAVTSAQGGDIGDIIQAATIAAVSSGIFEEIGAAKDALGPVGHVVAHAAVGCAMSAAAGGKCAAGALSAGFSVAAGSLLPKGWDFNERLVAHSVIGGVAAELGGGKFANGAVTAAFGYIYNAAKHKTWDKHTDRRIGTLDPKVQNPAADFINEVENVLGIKLRVTHAYRSDAEQDLLYAQGRTSPGKIVTNAKGGESFHNYGLAIDVVEIRGGKANWNTSWNALSKIGISNGFSWGGNWNQPDRPHFQMNFGLSIKQLQRGQKP